MLPIRQSRRAEEDLDRIFRESIDLLGKQQAEAYLACLLRAIGIIRQFPELGRQLDENPLLRRHAHGDVALYYRIDPDSVALLRVVEQVPVAL